MKEKRTGGQFRTSIGGQALIEGILMRGPKKQAIVVRSPEGLVREVEELHFIKDKYPILGWPIIRGMATFLSSIVTGVKALMFSADYFPELEESEPSKRDRWLEAHVSEQKLQSVMVWVSVILSLGMSIALFLLLPTFIAGLFHAQTPALHNLIEGVVKILVLLAYLILCSKQKDIKRVFSYHGAEHKTIFCYEAGLPLTGENARIQPRHHPRCGTSFLFVVVILSILISAIFSAIWPVDNMLGRLGLTLLRLPLIVAIAYEFNRLVGRHDNKLTRILSKPGMWLQYFTTQEPDDSMLEVGIRALELVLPEHEGEDKW